MIVKTCKFDKSLIVEHSNITFSNYGTCVLHTQSRFNSSTWISIKDMNNGAFGNYGAIKSVGEYIFSIQYTGELCVLKIDNDGILNIIYQDEYPHKYHSYESKFIVVSWERKKVLSFQTIRGGHFEDIEGYEYDISDINNITGFKFDLNDYNIPNVPFLLSQACGISIIGDYVYFPFVYGYDDIKRWNIHTHNIDYIKKPENSSCITRASSIYYPNSDRLYLIDSHGFTILTHPGAIDPEDVIYKEIRYNSIYSGTINQSPYDFNKIWIKGYNFEFTRLDITEAMTTDNKYGVQILNKLTSCRDDNFKITLSPSYFPEYGDKYIRLTGTSGNCPYGGWIDQENNNIVTIVSTSGTFRSNWGYSGPIETPKELVTSENGTKFWVHFWYGQKKVVSYNYEDGFLLNEESNVTFGPFKFDDDSLLINTIIIPNFNKILYIPSECSVDAYISNNNKDWEIFNYKISNTHTFKSIGNKVYFKLFLHGTPIKSPHIQAASFNIVLIKSYNGDKERDNKNKRMPLLGNKI